MPSRWHVTFPKIPVATVKLEHLHALVTSWFDTTTGAHNAPDKPYTITPPIAVPGGTAVQIGLLDDALADTLCKTALPGTRIRLGHRYTHLDTEPQQISHTTWAHLATPTPADAWCLRFLTPTTFRRRNNLTPWPAPQPVLGGLRHAWNTHAPHALSMPHLDIAADPLWITDVDGASHLTTITITQRDPDGSRHPQPITVSGYVGRIRYTCDAGPDTAAMIDALMRLTPYSGVGAYTSWGLGQVHLEPTWHQTP